ncbi:MAG TPA: ADOP family duplicated permease [Candidatus Acidoferrales bacterium]|nr:ADOP family duplicated permease [Candidatus Acidoferrales bacterium]
MSLTKRLASLFRRGRLDRELDEEMRFHVEQRTRDHIAAGMNPKAAREAALRSFGGVAKITERCREARGVQFLESLAQDFRYAIRTLSKDRRFALLAILALALGIGAATVIFSAFQGVLRNFMPYQNPSRLVTFAIHRPGDRPGRDRGRFSISEFMDFREQNHVFQDMEAMFPANGNCQVGKTTIPAFFHFVSPNAFSVLGVPPAVGVWPQAGNPADAPPVVAISDQMWKSQFNGDRSILGATFVCKITNAMGGVKLASELSDVPRRLVAVMPATMARQDVVWIPFPLNRSAAASDPLLSTATVEAMGRLKPGVGVAAARADLDVIAHHISGLYPKLYPKEFRVAATSLTGQRWIELAAIPFVVIVLIVLVIAYSNVANLLLSRATVRDREMALRASIGASRGRLVRQLLVESAVLAAAGCAAACFFAWLGLDGVVHLIPVEVLPEPSLVRLSVPALIFALCASLLCIFTCGLSPALRAIRGQLQSRLAGEGGATLSTTRGGKLRGALVAGQVTLAMVLLVSTGVMLHIFMATADVNIGYNPNHLIETQLPADYSGTTAAKARPLIPEILRRAALLPGVSSAAVGSLSPRNAIVSLGGAGSDITVTGTPPHSEDWFASVNAVNENYLPTIGLHLLSGRPITADDVASERLVAVVNQAFAEKFLAGQNPLGHNIKFEYMEDAKQLPKDADFEITGVVSNTSGFMIELPVPVPEALPPQPEAFVPYSTANLAMNLYVRTAANSPSVIRAIQEQMRAVDASAPISQPLDLGRAIHAELYGITGFCLVILGGFAGIGFLLVLVGLFSVTAYTVSLQTREIGIRMAFGAQRTDVLRMVLAKGLLLIAAGLAVGLFASFALTRLVGSHARLEKFDGVMIADPWAFGAVVVLIVATGLAACYFPARRAAQVDPLVALRHE